MAVVGLTTMKLAAAICLMLFLQSKIILGDHMLEIFVYRYVNPTHKSAGRGGQCCDENHFGPCTDQCDNLFHFCLRPRGYPQTRFDCPWGSHSTTSTLSDRLNFIFGEHEPFSNGVTNPLVFFGTGDWPGSFQLLVTVTDKDSTSSDLVDRLYIEVSVSVSSRFSPILAYEGTARWAFLYLSSRATNIVTTMAPSSPCSSGCSSDACGQMAPCQNGATCTNVGAEAYHCLCPQGYRGVNCSRVDIVVTGHNNTSTVATRSIPVPSRSHSTGESTVSQPMGSPTTTGPLPTTTGPSGSVTGIAVLTTTAGAVLLQAIVILAAVARVALYIWRRRNVQKDDPITSPNPAYACHDVPSPNQGNRQCTTRSHYYTTPGLVTKIRSHATGEEGSARCLHVSEGNTFCADEGLGLEQLSATPGSTNGSYVNEGLGPDWSKKEVHSTPCGGPYEANGRCTVTAEGSEVGEYDGHQYEHVTAWRAIDSEYDDPAATFENPYVQVVSKTSIV